MVILVKGTYVKNHINCALDNKFQIFGMVLAMGKRFSKTIANKLGSSPSGLFAQLLAAIVDAILKMMPLRLFFLRNFSGCYLVHPIVTESIGKSLLSIIWGFTHALAYLLLDSLQTDHQGASPTCLQWFLKTLYQYLTPCKISKTSKQVHNCYEFLYMKSQFIGILSSQQPSWTPSRKRCLSDFSFCVIFQYVIQHTHQQRNALKKYFYQLFGLSTTY